RYMRSALYLLMDDMVNEPATLVEIPRVFTDEEFRKKKLARSTNQQVIDFWTKEVIKTSGDQSLGNFAPYVSSKFDNFISNSYLRPIIGQAKSAFDFRQAMDEGKIILVNLSKGKVGDLSSSLLGMVVVGKILKAALSRVDIADERSRRDFYLYIDEFQNYTTDSIAAILSEARKYRLNLIVAHQFIAQLKDNIREAVFGNVGNMVSFRVGPPDAETLVKHFGPVFNEKDLISIENLNAFAKILVNGEPSKPFNMKITWPTGGSAVVRDGLKELSRLRFGQDLDEIEGDILKRLKN
ncbi:MAG: type IV secretory system conjugative DNA transfer family protein, partial [Candidatus Paceibacterota bacterium]